MGDLLELHFEELDFLWEERERVVFASDWVLPELAELEGRADAHLDALRIGERASLQVVEPALSGEEAGAATAATFVLLASGEPEGSATVLDALVAGPPPVREGIRIGLRHTPAGGWLEGLRERARDAEPAVRAAICDVLAFHRLDAAEHMDALLDDPDPDVRRLAVLAAGRGVGPWDAARLEHALASGEAPLRWAALEAAAKRATPELLRICRAAAAGPGAPPEALAFLGVVGREEDLALLEQALAHAELAEAAASGLGSMGSVVAIPRLLEAMRDPRLCRAAGEAFQRITGARDIEGEPPPPPAELDEDEAAFWDDDPAPDPDLAEEFWEVRRAHFDPAGRWQAGRRVDVDLLGEGFDGLPLRVRRDLYLARRASDSAPDLELERRAALQLGPLS
jgi:uncharacterized protein (TIGR02270 family)